MTWFGVINRGDPRSKALQSFAESATSWATATARAALSVVAVPPSVAVVVSANLGLFSASLRGSNGAVA